MANLLSPPNRGHSCSPYYQNGVQRGGGGVRGYFAAENLGVVKFPHPWESSSSNSFIHTLTCKPMLYSES